MQLNVSPGMAENQLRISARARPSPSSTWRVSGWLAGAVKMAEPSGFTGTVPYSTFKSQLLSMPMA